MATKTMFCKGEKVQVLNCKEHDRGFKEQFINNIDDKEIMQEIITLSMLHATIVAISRLVEKVPSLELLRATEFSMRLV